MHKKLDLLIYYHTRKFLLIVGIFLKGKAGFYNWIAKLARAKELIKLGKEKAETELSEKRKGRNREVVFWTMGNARKHFATIDAAIAASERKKEEMHKIGKKKQSQI